MKVSNNGIGFISKWEGLSLAPYKDVGGRWTIGYGHLLEDGEEQEEITMEEARRLLVEDLKEVEKAINTYVEVPLSQNKFDALASFTYNLGGHNLYKSTLLKRVNEGSHLEAAMEFQRWSHVKGKTIKGLLRRRLAEASLYISD